MVKLRITPNGAVLESEIVISGETLVRLTNPENAKQIKDALTKAKFLNCSKVSHRLEESDKNVSIMSRPVKDGENIESVLEKLFKTHTEFIDQAQSLPAPTSTIDFKDPDEDEEDKVDNDKEVIKSMVENLKEILNDDPRGCIMTLFVRKGVGKLMLPENGIKTLLNTFIEKYDKEKESL